MASDVFLTIVLIPTLCIVVVLVLLRGFASLPWGDKTVFGLAWRRAISGILGALAGLFLFAAIASYIMAVARVAEHEELRAQGALSLAAGWTLYLFFIVAPFLLAGMALLFFPALAVLYWMRLVSAAGVGLFAGALVAINAGFAYLYPANNWCEANLGLCILFSIASAAAFAVPVAAGFVIGARLPLLRSTRAGRGR